MNQHLLEVRHTCLADPEHHYSMYITAPGDRPAREVVQQTAAQFGPWVERTPSWTVQVIYRAHLRGNVAAVELKRSA